MGVKGLELKDIEKILRAFNKINEFPIWEFDLKEEHQASWLSILELIKESSISLRVNAAHLSKEREGINPPEKKAKNKAKDKEFRDMVKKIYNYRCIKCGVYDKISRCTLHHLKKVCDGGKTELSNLSCLCRPCHDTWHAIAEPKGINFWEWVCGKD